MLPDRHSYDLYLHSMQEDAVVFGGRSLFYASALAFVAALCWIFYFAQVRGLPFESTGMLAHLLILLGGVGALVGAAVFFNRRERLTLERGGAKATYKLDLGAKRYSWEAPLGAFSSVSAELEARSDGKGVGPLYWAFYLNKWDGGRVRFGASGFKELPAARREKAAQLAQALAAFLECEAQVAAEGRIAAFERRGRASGGARKA